MGSLKKALVIFSILLVFALLVSSANANAIQVCEECDFSNIQDAINASKEGDTILIAPGTYRENLKIEKSVNIVGGEKTTLEPKIRLLPTIQVISTPNVVIEGMRIINGSTGLEILYSGDLDVKNCVFQDNMEAIKITESMNITIQRLEIKGCAVGVTVEHSTSIKLKDSFLEGDEVGIEVSASRKILLSNLILQGFQKGVKLSGGMANRVKDVVFVGREDRGDGEDSEDSAFLSTFSEYGFIVSGSIAEKGVFIRDQASHGSLYSLKNLNVSGEEFQLSIVRLNSLPEGLVMLSDSIYATVIPDVYTEAGYIYMESNLSDEEIKELSKQINVSTLAFYRLGEETIERTSDYYNTSDSEIALSFMSNKSGIYVLAAKSIQPEKPVLQTPTPTTPTPISTSTEQPESIPRIPGFESLTALTGILVALVMLVAIPLRRTR